MITLEYPFKLNKLPFEYNSLEPIIDTKTMQIHFNQHFNFYINKLNEILKDYKKLQSFSLEKLIRNNRYLPIQIRNEIKNYVGGVYNHNLYFETLTPHSKGKPDGKLKAAIENSFSSFEEFILKFKSTANRQMGSSYVWLLVDRFGKISITSSLNQDTPINTQMKPILGLDLWEHAYYLRYNNRKEDYVANWFKIINWDKVQENYLSAIQKSKTLNSNIMK